MLMGINETEDIMQKGKRVATVDKPVATVDKPVTGTVVPHPSEAEPTTDDAGKGAEHKKQADKKDKGAGEQSDKKE
jgi:hypothetical protein